MLHTAPAEHYTREEFHQAVLATKPQIAVFDCDGTLWSGDAGYGFMVWSIETGLVSRNTADWVDSQYRAYLAGKVSEVEMCGEMVQMYADLREEEMRRAAATYFRTHIEANIFPELRELIADLRANGTELWAVSSTNNWVIEEGVKRFGIPASHVLAAEVRVTNGLITSELVGVPTDEAKAEALIRSGVANPDCVFGNSIHDEAMLKIAKHAFPVNPTPALLQNAADNGWTVFYPASVMKDSKV
ncbi:HAD family phosphatase [Acidobacterium sp. S8]|uniref:HAD family hydrolase n=1 Tax=Acidobacterium sp. S8 TaxID=1641854 RepID=UPI00131E3248|nr:haloacid dehalogenase-like hydrolase [Acidobacterium sp. S8]